MKNIPQFCIINKTDKHYGEIRITKSVLNK
jgi:hypothetical protein